MAGYTKVVSPSRFLKNSNNNIDFIKNKNDEKIHVRYPKQKKYKNKVQQSSTYSKNKVFFYQAKTYYEENPMDRYGTLYSDDISCYEPIGYMYEEIAEVYENNQDAMHVPVKYNNTHSDDNKRIKYRRDDKRIDKIERRERREKRINAKKRTPIAKKSTDKQIHKQNIQEPDIQDPDIQEPANPEKPDIQEPANPDIQDPDIQDPDIDPISLILDSGPKYVQYPVKNAPIAISYDNYVPKSINTHIRPPNNRKKTIYEKENTLYKGRFYNHHRSNKLKKN